MQRLFKGKITITRWQCDDGSVAQLVALLLFSVKVTDPAMAKQNKGSSRNWKIPVQKSSGELEKRKAVDLIEGQTIARSLCVCVFFLMLNDISGK